jgi:hypothetical protein
MRYFIDTEFNEDGQTIKLLSIAIVAEDGRELYLVNDEARIEDCNEWVQANVWPYLFSGLDADRDYLGRTGIRLRIEDFIGSDPDPEFWGYFADYDWVVFCWLWGAMVQLPKNFPRYCMDLKQEAKRLGVKPKDLVPPPTNAHNALADARWNAELFAALAAR